jgi:hypothetical protein
MKSSLLCQTLLSFCGGRWLAAFSRLAWRFLVEFTRPRFFGRTIGRVEVLLKAWALGSLGRRSRDLMSMMSTQIKTYNVVSLGEGVVTMNVRRWLVLDVSTWVRSVMETLCVSWIFLKDFGRLREVTPPTQLSRFRANHWNLQLDHWLYVVETGKSNNLCLLCYQSFMIWRLR